MSGERNYEIVKVENRGAGVLAVVVAASAIAYVLWNPFHKRGISIMPRLSRSIKRGSIQRCIDPLFDFIFICYFVESLRIKSVSEYVIL